MSAKRYRYTGKEKDEETGLYYHGARYYAPWLARWMGADPIGLGVNRYAYVRGNPVGGRGPTGMARESEEQAGSGIRWASFVASYEEDLAPEEVDAQTAGGVGDFVITPSERQREHAQRSIRAHAERQYGLVKEGKLDAASALVRTQIYALPFYQGHVGDAETAYVADIAWSSRASHLATQTCGADPSRR